jgi:uncharacterized membrane protein YhaH (DUF805 family)
MNSLLSFAINLLITLLVGFLLVAYLRPSLRRILVDLCGTEERAAFWLAFASLVLIGMPIASALGYVPLPAFSEESFYGLAHQLSQNLTSFLVGLVGVGLVIGFFALVAPRIPKARAS